MVLLRGVYRAQPLVRLLRSTLAGLYDHRLIFRGYGWGSLEVLQRGLRRLSATFSRAQLSLEHQWKNAAPVWQRTKASLLHWLEQPQRWRRSLAVSDSPRPIPVAPLTPLKVTAWPKVNRAQTRLRKPRPQSAALPSSEPGVNVNVIVMRWLRQPFRGATSTHSRIATSRNR